MKNEKLKKVVVSVPGKIHLMGEHAVVHGKPGIVTAINLRLYASVSPAKKLQIISKEDPRLIKKAVEIVCNRFKLKNSPKVKIEINSQLPVGRHAGSSAAVSVAVVSALTYYLKKIWNPNLFNELAYEVEKFQHGTPSGGDNSTCTFGGFIWYRKEFEFLKNIWQLPLKFPKKLLNFYLIDTGRPKENTGELIASVKKLFDKNPKKGVMLLSENEKATKEVVLTIKNNDEKSLITAIKKGEKTLEQMGVVSKKAKKLIKNIENIGGAAKILGGGGQKDAVGLVLCYHQKREKLLQVAKKYHYSLIDVLLGEEGLRREFRIKN